MRRFTLFLALLLSVTLGAVAQTVASDPTTFDNLKSGYYVIRVSCTGGNATASYLYASDSKVYYDKVGSEKTLTGKKIKESTMKYLFYVKKTKEKLYISLWDNSISWPNISTAGITNWTPGRQDQFTMNSTQGEFTATASDDAYLLSLSSSYYSWGTKSSTAYVVLNSSQKVGYSDEENKDDVKAHVQFFAVTGTPGSFTYNMTRGGSTVKSETHTAFVGQSFPKVSYDYDSYYIKANIPTSKVTADNFGTEIEVPLTEGELPFTTNKYYYLGTAGDSPVMISHSSDDAVAYRSLAQADTYNDILKDLWYITGDVFNGFHFVNASSNAAAMSKYGISTVYGSGGANPFSNSAVLQFSGTDSSTELWDIKKGENDGFIVYTHDGESYNRYWSYKDNAINFINKDGYEKNFKVYEPEFTFPMNTVGDASYNSIALPFAAQLAEGETTKMYQGKVNGSVLNVEEVTTGVPANAGVVLIGKKGATTAKFVAVMDASSLDNNDLVGTTVQIANADLSDKLIFGVSDQTGNVGFFSANSTAVLSANRAYLNKTEATMKALSIHIGGETTGITLPVTDTTNASAPVYDLSGRRVTSTVKGHLYIQNGRKFIAE